MLEFNKLVLTGFKSFVDPTELLIEPGLSAVVGPNGCGKSNLLEALRWVMGESSAKRMRGGEMDDVIFGGSADRPARNIAEVKLVINNTTKEAPAIFNEFEDLEVTRRIERDKGSRYRVNGKDNRARDVQLLFADAGSGAQSNSLVGQGRIGAIIGAKPTERRVLLEEAAGIAGLYSRRHEAELRLRAAESNLQRLDDIQETLHAQLRSLARQAKQAERYRALNEELRRLEATVFYLDWIAFNQARENAKSAVREAQRLVGERTQLASSAEREAMGANESIKSAREEDAVAAAVLQRLEHTKENLDAERKRRVDARDGLERQIAKLREDRMRETTLSQEAKTSIQRLSEEQAQINQTAAADPSKDTDISAKVEKAAAVFTSEQADLDNITQKRATLEAERQAAKKSIYDLERQQNDLNQKVQRAQTEHQKSKARLEALNANTPETSPEDLETQLSVCDQSLGEQELRRDQISNDLETARNEQRELESANTRLQAEVKGLEEALAASSSDTQQQGQTPVLDLVKVEPGFEAALASALGEDLDAPLFEGDANFERAWHNPQNDENLNLPSAGGLPNLAKFVDAPRALHARLSFVFVADSHEQAVEASKSLESGQRIVTKSGGLWRWDGYQETEAYKGAAGLAQTRLVQRNRLEALKAQLVETQPALMSGQENLAKLKATLQQGDEELGHLRQERRRLESDLSGLRTLLAKSASERAELDGLLRNLDAQLIELAEQQEGNKQALTAQSQSLEDESKLELLLNQLNDKRAKVADARLALNQAESERDRLAFEREQRQARQTTIGMELKNWQSRQQQAENRQQDFDQRLTENNTKLEASKAAPDEIGAQLTKLAIELDKATTNRKKAGDALALAETNQLRLAKAERDAERSLSESREALVRAEAQVEQAEQRSEELVDRIRERLAVVPQRLLELAEVEDPETLPERKDAEARRQRALSQREAMGAVNLRADQETEELRSELAKYETEREDVQAAVNKLREGIDELNVEGRAKLLEAFAQVQGHFRVLFTRLFGGGEAELALVDSDDPLEAGLQVLASPPGKKMQILSLLSGGEQALTAMSLLFAVFMTKPAPVCVLDEVDAPLDDENCIRFCDLIRDMAQKTGTRFLVVTHNPHTMARVDRLFGVTMAEKGVSQLMSINLQTAESLAKRA